MTRSEKAQKLTESGKIRSPSRASKCQDLIQASCAVDFVKAGANGPRNGAETNYCCRPLPCCCIVWSATSIESINHLPHTAQGVCKTCLWRWSSRTYQSPSSSWLWWQVVPEDLSSPLPQCARPMKRWWRTTAHAISPSRQWRSIPDPERACWPGGWEIFLSVKTLFELRWQFIIQTKIYCEEI
jgi:hypothetical protein